MLLCYAIPMMGYGGYGLMGGAGTFGIITWLVVIIDLVLLGVWLWKQINK
ncbi:MAG: hypothetical protein UY56_C0004G0022 [Parcubacteria group bacterium GW2011_GWA1_50_14]|nr:MAG: hypothetical protein UY56_C0004G0022 [Parcubacteria group bacterium GW2011_GWA1_50_14]